jgi:hypothetical protein
MNVRVEPDRFLSVACEPDERIVFDRKETKYHLLRDSAARLWDDFCEGGTFEVAAGPEENEPLTLLAEAGLIGIDEDASSEGITRRVWLRRTGKVSAAAVVLPLVASITTPRLALGQVPSIEEEIEPTGQTTGQTDITPETGPLSESPLEKNGRTPKDERNQLKEETGNSGGGVGNTGTPPANTESTENHGTRTRTRSRTGQTTTTETEPGTRTRTRRGDR